MDQWLRKFYVSVRNALNCVRLLGTDGVVILIESWLGSRRTVPVSVRGQSMEVRLNTTDLATLLQIFWNEEYRFELGREPQVIIDGGANVGYASLYFAHRFPNARIISVEPHPENYAQLCRNTSAYSQISPVQAAVWHKDEDLGLWDPEEGYWGFRVSNAADGDNAANGDGRLMIKGVSISSLVDQFELSLIDVLKLDIEGSEKEVFEHSADWIDIVGVIVAELHDKYRVGCARAFYTATQDFTDEIRMGENILMLRAHYRP